MRGYQQGMATPMAAALIALVLAVGTYIYTQKSLPAKEESVELAEAPLPQATSTGLGNVTDAVEATAAALQNVFLSSADKCEQEVRADLVALRPFLIQVSFVEVQAFGSATQAREFLIFRGYKNPSGRTLADIAAAEEATDFSVAIIAMQSQLPDKQDDKQLVTMRLTQPVVCVGGSVASSSKSFLTTILKNESGVRSALYQSGEVVN